MQRGVTGWVKGEAGELGGARARGCSRASGNRFGG